MYTGERISVPWATGKWTNKPAALEKTSLGLTVTATEKSDAWRTNANGLSRSSENALLGDFRPGQAVEVAFIADMIEQYDQAGVFLRVNEEHWAKAGMELSDGLLQLGAVVTRGESDWSACCVPDWNGRPIRVRASWNAGTVVVSAKVDKEPFRLVRIFPLPETLEVKAGPFLASPTRRGLSITFTDWCLTEADSRKR